MVCDLAPNTRRMRERATGLYFSFIFLLSRWRFAVYTAPRWRQTSQHSPTLKSYAHSKYVTFFSFLPFPDLFSSSSSSNGAERDRKKKKKKMVIVCGKAVSLRFVVVVAVVAVVLLAARSVHGRPSTEDEWQQQVDIATSRDQSGNKERRSAASTPDILRQHLKQVRHPSPSIIYSTFQFAICNLQFAIL